MATGRRERFRAWREKFVVETRVLPADALRKLYLTSGILVAVGLVSFFIVLVDMLNQGPISSIDQPVQDLMQAGRSDVATTVLNALSVFFGPLVFPWFALAVTLYWMFTARHLWRPFLLALGTAVGVVGVRIIAEVVGRQRPPISGMLFEPDHSESFPSGHVIGAALFILLIAYLVFSRRETPKRVVLSYSLAAVAIVVTALSRLYLGYHWTTDALASVCLALVVLGGIVALDTWRTVRVGKSA